MAKNNAWQRAGKVVHSAGLQSKPKWEGAAPGHPGESTELMDVRGLAEYLRLDKQTIYNWLHQHKLTGIKVGGVWRFDRRAIEVWLKDQTVDARTLRQRRKRNGSLSSGG
jgi:excisionase family DNA binding protein